MNLRLSILYCSILLASVFILKSDADGDPLPESQVPGNSTGDSSSSPANNITETAQAQHNGSNSGNDSGPPIDVTTSNKTSNETSSANNSTTTTTVEPAEVPFVNTTDNPDNSTETLPPAAPETTTTNSSSTDDVVPPESSNTTDATTTPAVNMTDVPVTDGNTTDADNTTDAAGNDTATTVPPAPASEGNVTDGNSTVPSTEPPQPPQPSVPTVKIGETNLLLVGPDASDSLFIELQGEPEEDLTGLWLLVRDAGQSTSAGDAGLLVKLKLESSLDSSGRHLLDNSTGLDFGEKLKGVQAVFIGLYQQESQADSLGTDGLVDLLLYSTQGGVDPALEETFSQVTKFPLILDYSQLPAEAANQELSLSRCSDASSNAAFVLAPATSDGDNACSLPSSQNMAMWLSLTQQPCPDQLPSDFGDELVKKVITEVNGVRMCGLSRPMLDDLHVSKSCVSERKTRVDVYFTMQAAFSSHLDLVMQAYKMFVSDQSTSLMQLQGGDYVVHNCSQLCSAPVVNPVNHDDDKKTQVTVGVVLACVGVFMVVLLSVIMYMKRKRRGILQFRMTRLDEDDDDLIGDMDDFVGNQGPTFRTFR